MLSASLAMLSGFVALIGLVPGVVLVGCVVAPLCFCVDVLLCIFSDCVAIPSDIVAIISDCVAILSDFAATLSDFAATLSDFVALPSDIVAIISYSFDS